MKNVLLPRPEYRNFRTWLRSTQIVWRDVIDSSIIPQWGESVCNQDVCFESKTPGEIAYQCLRTNYPHLDLQWRKDELRLLDLRPPKYFDGQFRGQCYGLDISHAYAQLYSRLYLHGDWPRKRLKYPLVEVANELDPLKSARNAVVGIVRSTRNKWVQGEKVWYVNKKNPFLSPVLWGHLQSILNEIAVWSIELGAVFVNTDGYVFRTEKEKDNLKSKLDSFGIQTKSFQGIGAIVGISGLHIPAIKQPLVLDVSKPVFHLEPVESGWVEWWSKLKQGE